MVDNQSTEEAVKMDTAKKEISDAVDYYRWDEEDKSIALDSIDKNPEIFKALVEAKNHEGKPLFSAEGIAEIFFSWKDTIENHPDKIKAVLSNPDECYGKYTSSNVRVFMDKVEHPRFSTIVQNPEVFIYTKSQITEGTLFYIQDFLDYKYGRPNSEIRDVINMVDKNPEIFKTLTEAKDNEGKLLFNENDLRYMGLSNFKYLMRDCVDDAAFLNEVKIVLSIPDEIDDISSRSPEKKFGTLWGAARYPTASTININPRAFGYGPYTKEEILNAINEGYHDKSISETVVADMIDKHPDIVKILTDAKDKEGMPLFKAWSIGAVLSGNKDIIENRPNIIKFVLNTSDDIDFISDTIPDSLQRVSRFRDLAIYSSHNIGRLADLRKKLTQKDNNMSRDDIEFNYERINPELAALRAEERNKVEKGMDPKQAQKERREAVKAFYNKISSREE